MEYISGLMICPATCVCRVWLCKVSMVTVSSVTVKKPSRTLKRVRHRKNVLFLKKNKKHAQSEQSNLTKEYYI